MTPAMQAPAALRVPPVATAPALETPSFGRTKATHLSLQAALRRTLAFDVPLPGVALVDLADSEDAWIAACDIDLRATLRHVLQHAVRHCPEGHRIDVAVLADHPGASVVVRDAAPCATWLALPGTLEIDAVATGAHACLLEPELVQLQRCARQLGARVLVGDRQRPRSAIACEPRVFLSVQFPPPFNVVAGDA